MKNIFAPVTSLIFGLFFYTHAFADGCLSLNHTAWVGQFKSLSGDIVPINVTITNVKGVGGCYYFVGTLNGEPITSTKFGCMEQHTSGHISMISFNSASGALTATKFSPDDKNPMLLNEVDGRWKYSYVNTTTDPGKNYFIRSN